jgi:phage tail-like protein
MPAAKDPRLGGHFRVTLGDKESIGVFREVSGISSETELVDQVEGGGRPIVRRVPGRIKFGTISLKRGVDADLGLWKWRQQAEQDGADAARVDGTIELLDAQGRAVTTYKFHRGWPSKYLGPDLNAASNDIPIETIEITHEGLDRT